MPEDLSDLIQYAVQLPLVGVVIGIVIYFVRVMREERKESDQTREVERVAFLEALDKERETREGHNDKLNNTLTGLTTSVDGLDRTITELRTDVRNQNA